VDLASIEDIVEWQRVPLEKKPLHRSVSGQYSKTVPGSTECFEHLIVDFVGRRLWQRGMKFKRVRNHVERKLLGAESLEFN
jgi:hypothetical protein